MKEEKNKNSEKHIILLFFLLFTLIVIIFLLANFLGMIDHNPLIPTGNIDIFDINFIKGGNDCICDNKNDSNSDDSFCDNSMSVSGPVNDNKNDNENNPSSDSNTSDNFVPVNGSANDNKFDDDVYVYDNKTLYSKGTPLNIFTQPAYHIANNRIAPLSENSYQFIIRNNTDLNIKYNLEIKEINQYNINMKFRLRINNSYVAGSKERYVSADELNQYDISLASKNYNVYTLDWKWFESSNDTEVGMDINSKYKLDLEITASEY